MRNRTSVMVLGPHRQSLAVVRALAAAGLDVVFGYPTPSGPGYVGHSRRVQQLWAHPPFDCDRWHFVTALLAHLDAHPEIRFVFPVGYSEIRAFGCVRDVLPRRVHCLMVRSDLLEVCQSKSKLNALARELGVPTAPSCRVETSSELLGAADAVGYPCVLKAETEGARAFGRKAWIVGDRAALAGLLETRVVQGPMIVQAYVVGARHNVYFFAEAGLVRAAAQVEILRTDRLDGTGYAVEGVTVPLDVPWRAHLERLTRHLAYDGPGCLQFIRGDEGRCTLLELNPRIGANHAAVEAIGLHLPRWWIEHAQDGRATIPERFEYPAGVRYGWFTGDIAGWMTTRNDPNASRRARLSWAVSLVRTLSAPHHVVWDWHDPGPALRLTAAALLPHASSSKRRAPASAR